MTRVYFGIDAGNSKTQAVIADESGAVLTIAELEQRVGER